MNTIQNIDLEIEKLKTAKDVAFEIYSHYSEAYFKLKSYKAMKKNSLNQHITETLINELINIAEVDTTILYSKSNLENVVNLKYSFAVILTNLGCNPTDISKFLFIDRSTVYRAFNSHADRLKYYKDYNNIFSNLASYENHLSRFIDTV